MATTRLLNSMPSSSSAAPRMMMGSPHQQRQQEAAVRPHADSAPPALRSFRSNAEPDPATQKMVVRIYFSDGAFKSIMITGATTALEACHMFAEKVRMERFQNNFQLKEVTPSVQRMVGHDERPFEVVHRWIKEGFKLSMDEKWRFVFTFSQEAQNRLLRKTKRLLFSQVQSELKQQLKGSGPAPPKLGLKSPVGHHQREAGDEPPECPRPSPLPPSPRMQSSTSNAVPPPVSPRVRNAPSAAAAHSSSAFSLLESSTSNPSRAAVSPEQEAAASCPTPFFVSTSPTPQTATLRGGFSSLPPHPVTPRPQRAAPSPQSVPSSPISGSPAGSIRQRRGTRPSPLILTAFNIDNEAQLAEAESKYNSDPTQFTSVYVPNEPSPSSPRAAQHHHAQPAATTAAPPTQPVLTTMDLPPPPASMVLPGIPQVTTPPTAAIPRHEVTSGGWSSDSDCDSYYGGEDEGEDELVAMLVQSTLKDSQARGITIRDCSEQMISNLDDALAMLAKLEFDL